MEKNTVKPYTMEEIESMLSAAESDFDAGRCYSTKEVIDIVKKNQSQLAAV